MDEQTIRAIIREVLQSAMADGAKAQQPPSSPPPSTVSASAVSGGIPLEVSARHVHLTEQDVERLFGAGAKLTKKRDLSQRGEFLSEQRVKLITKKGVMENVAVLGPVRKATQVELSLTDCRALDIHAPIRLSGELADAGDVMIAGDCGCILARNCVIAARAHVHMTPDEAHAYGVRDGDHVSVEIQSARPVTLGDVIVRVRESFALACHIDIDEANAAAVTAKTTARVVGRGGLAATSDAGAVRDAEAKHITLFDGKVVTEAMAVEARVPGSEVHIQRGVIVTPAAKDIFSNAHMQVTYI